jgi:thymidine kinase
LARVVDTIGINVVCYGLRTDFKSKLFAGSKRLFELADSIEEIKSYCDCGNRAIINARFDSNGKMVTEGEQLLLGGDETYRAICRECFFNNITKEEMVTDNETN